MSLFHSILEELSKKLSKKESYKEDIARDITTCIGVTVSADQIRVKNGSLYLSVSPTIKTVLHLKKVSLLKQLQKYNITTIV